MSIVTKTGDKGETGLFGGKRIPKDATRIATYGTVDELNAILGVVVAEDHLPTNAQRQLRMIQHLLFRLGGDLATPADKRSKEDRISADHIAELELAITELEKILPAQTNFILPGGSKPAAYLHLARTVCRCAERLAVTLKREEPINDDVTIFLNRLSDYLFVLARKVNADLGVPDVPVEY